MSFYKLFRDTASYLMAMVHLSVWLYFALAFINPLGISFLGEIVALPFIYFGVYLVICLLALICKVIEKYSAPTTGAEKFFNFYWYLSPALYFVIAYLMIVTFAVAWGGGGGGRGEGVAYLFGGIMILMLVMDLILFIKVILGFIRERKINLNWTAVVLCCLVVYLPAQVISHVQKTAIQERNEGISVYIDGIEKALKENGFKTEKQDYTFATNLISNFDCFDPIGTSVPDTKQFGIVDQYLKNNGFIRQLKILDYEQKTIFSVEYNKCEIESKNIKNNYSDSDMNCSVEWRKVKSGNGCQIAINCSFSQNLDACREKRILKNFPTDITDFGKKLEEFVGDNIQTRRCYVFEQKCIIEEKDPKIICIVYIDDNVFGRLGSFFTTNGYQIDMSSSQLTTRGAEQCYRKGNIACLINENKRDVTCGRPQTQP